MDINRSQLRHSKIYTLPNPNSTPPKKKQTTICGYEQKIPLRQTPRRTGINSWIASNNWLTNCKTSWIAQWPGAGAFRAGLFLHNGGVISWKIPIYIFYILDENQWVSLGVIKPINWSYGPLVIVEANFCMVIFARKNLFSLLCFFFVELEW